MASVRKRGDSYQITVSNGRDSSGKQITETATYTPDPGMTERKIEKELNAFVVDFERAVKSGQNVKGERMTLKQLAERFIEDSEPTGGESDFLEKTTWANYKLRLEQKIIPCLGHNKIKLVTPKLLNDYAKECRQDGARLDGRPGGLSESTIRKDCAIVSSLLSYAVGEGFIPINPLIYSGKQNRRKQSSKEYKVDYFTIEQTKWFLWALDNVIQIKRKAHDRIDDTGKPYKVPEYTQAWKLDLKWRAYFSLMLFTGCRRGETISLTWDDINFENGEINVDKSTGYVSREIIHKGTKGNKSRTTVIPKPVISALEELRTEQKKTCVKLGTKWVGYKGEDFGKNYIFTQWDGKQIHPSSPYHQFKRIIRIYNENVARNENEKIPETATQHDLRHTAASILISNKMDPRSVAGILGHANATTTLNIYSYFFRSKTQEAADIMTGALLDAK